MKRTEPRDDATYRPLPAQFVEDIRLPDFEIAADRAPARLSGTVLLTGVTGFLGGWVCRELLACTDADVLCLVRASNAEQAAARLRQRLEQVAVPARDTHRISAIAGDLSKPRLGVRAAVFERLCASVDSIVHCAASINLAASYESLRSANVIAVRDLLTLAATTRLKTLHHVSTASVFAEAARLGAAAVDEYTPVRPEYAGSVPYVQTKVAAELLVSAGRRRGIPAAVYRPALIRGHSTQAAVPVNDTVHLLLAACIQAGAAPLTARTVPAGTVDDVAGALVALACDSPARTGTYHLFDRWLMPWGSVFAALRAYGHDAGTIPFDQWISLLRRLRGRGPARSLAAMRTALPALLDDGCAATMPLIRNEATRSTLISIGANGGHAVDATQLQREISSLTDAGLLPRPVIHASTRA